MAHRLVLILDYGSQYTQLIARRIRELGLYSRVLPGDCELERVKELRPSAVILSGGPSSVYDPGAPQLPHGFAEYAGLKGPSGALASGSAGGVPVLGVCYGMQLLARELGGEVKGAEVREYGRMKIQPSQGAKAPFASSRTVWMSHGDEVKRLPEGFCRVAETESGTIAAMVDEGRKVMALQFHPEVTHTENGVEFLRDFLFRQAGLEPDWTMGSVLDEQVALIKQKVGPDAHAICALSGGVDSAVAAALVHRAIGDRLHCVFVDHGLMRFREGDRVMKLFREQLKLPVERVDASERFLGQLAGVSDPERKRKIIGAEFIRCFDHSAQALGRELGKAPAFLVQGTLYPDVIESSPPPSSQGSGKKHSTTIKSHHNVGGLPEDLPFQLVEPLRDLFKDEVRALGRVLGVPADFLERHPFPGPGLAVRVIGEITRERLEILRQVDEIFINAIHEAGLYAKIWQAFAVFLPVRSVGVQGDGRTHDHVVALRAVTSSDGMTADWYPFEPGFLAGVSSRICNEVRGVNRVTYDISSKPPATIEWE